MKIKIIILSIFANATLYGQDVRCILAKHELDSVIFNWKTFNKYFVQGNDTDQCVFETTEKVLWYLKNVATYNSYIGDFLPGEIIRVQFQFSNPKRLKNTSFYYQGLKMVLSFDPWNDGFFLHFKSSMEGANQGMTFSERKNGENNGIEINYYFSQLSDSFFLEKKFYKAGLQTGRYLSYYSNGQIKIDGDSVIATKIRKTKIPKQ